MTRRNWNYGWNHGQNHSWTLLPATLLSLAACEPDVVLDIDMAANMDADGAAGPAVPGGQDASSEPLLCDSPTPVECHCPDGSLETQLCMGDGTYSGCPCAPTPITAEPRSVAPTEDAVLCTELAGASGCEARSYVSDRLGASILFLVDRSGSMACNDGTVQTSADCEIAAAAKDPEQPSKWDITTDALRATFAALESDDVRAGVSFFSVDDVCAVKSTPDVSVETLSAKQVAALGGALDGIQPGGGTPIVGATVLAYRHLHQEAVAPGNRFVVLITDGEESCPGAKKNLATLLDVEVAKAVGANIRTFVIGAPGSEGARGFLSELAFRSGTSSAAGCSHGDDATGDCHFDMTTEPDFAAALQSALEEISGRAVGCEFPVPPTEQATQDVNVQLTEGAGSPECLARDDSAACDGGADGWQFAKKPDGTEDLSKVVLCGDACSRFESSPDAKVDVVLGCVSII